MFESLKEIVAGIDAHKGSWKNTQLTQDAKMFLWARYDPNDDLIYPTINNWDDLLLNTVKLNSYDELTRDEVLSVLFGLIHRTRISETVWQGMFDRGVTQKLLERLLVVDTEKLG